VLPLAQQSSAIVIPCHSPRLGQLERDPRLTSFLQNALAHGATLLTGQLDPLDAAGLSPTPHRIQSCHDRTAYGTIAERLATKLALV
jgi:hypothetical protein